MGMTCFILITMWVTDEISFDKFHLNKERIFRVNSVTSTGNVIRTSSLRLCGELQNKYPEIEHYSRVVPWGRSMLRYNDKVFDEQNIHLVDSTFFKIFTFEFIKGDPGTALDGLFKAVITESTAEKYFGNNDPIGKKLYSDVYERDFEVSGVIKDVPHNSYFQFNIVGRVELMPERRRLSWEYTSDSFIMLKSNSSPEDFEKKSENFYMENVDENWTTKLALQNFANIHLYANGEPGIIKRIYIFSSIALFILFLSYINFMNLSTARSTRRALEVGIRKATGADRKQLAVQFLSESVVMALFAVVLALLFTELLLPYYNTLVQKELTLFGNHIAEYLIGILALAIISGIVAGSYPALILSSFKPERILKNKNSAVRSTSVFRRTLTIFQFTISVGLIIVTIIMSRQLDYIQNVDLGMNRDMIISMPNNPVLMEKFDAYADNIKRVPGVENITASATRPFNVSQWIEMNWEGHMNEEAISMCYTVSYYNFLETFDINLILGRDFSLDFANDETESCIINKKLAQMMGYKNPVGKGLYFDHPAIPEDAKNLKIIGVVDDFNFRPLNEETGPFVIKMNRPWHQYVYIKIDGNNIPETLSSIKAVNKEFSPEYPFLYEFIDDTYNRIYFAEMNLNQLFNVFAVLAIFISCLGLFGLASYTAEQKRKEIGIRKVLGSSIIDVILMLTKEYIKWVLIANIIAWPIAYYFMSEWLEDFVYKIDITLDSFFLAGALALVIAVGTVTFHSIKAALSNPVDSLKYE